MSLDVGQCKWDPLCKLWWRSLVAVAVSGISDCSRKGFQPQFSSLPCSPGKKKDKIGGYRPWEFESISKHSSIPPGFWLRMRILRMKSSHGGCLAPVSVARPMAGTWGLSCRPQKPPAPKVTSPNPWCLHGQLLHVGRSHPPQSPATFCILFPSGKTPTGGCHTVFCPFFSFFSFFARFSCPGGTFEISQRQLESALAYASANKLKMPHSPKLHYYRL